jgi:hypothetical protein
VTKPTNLVVSDRTPRLASYFLLAPRPWCAKTEFCHPPEAST